MELIFVGTSSGKTSKDRFHSSLLFKTNSNNVLIDTGDSISRALLAQKISVNSISDIIYSHYHSDHLAGLPSLLTQMIIENRKGPLTIYTHTDLLEPIKEFIKISFLFVETFKFEINFVGFDFNKSYKINDEFNFIAKQNSHIRNKHNLTSTNIEFISSSFLFKTGNQNIIYTSDIGKSDDLYIFQDHEANLFITETTHIPLNKIEDAITILDPERTILTHIENELELTDWYNSLTEKFRKKIILAHDGLNIEL